MRHHQSPNTHAFWVIRIFSIFFSFFALCDKAPVFVRKSMRDFHFEIAIRIPIKNRSGKNGIRFSFFDRSAFFPAKSIRDFFVKTGSRLKSLPAGAVVIGEHASPRVHK